VLDRKAGCRISVGPGSLRDVLVEPTPGRAPCEGYAKGRLKGVVWTQVNLMQGKRKRVRLFKGEVNSFYRSLLGALIRLYTCTIKNM